MVAARTILKHFIAREQYEGVGARVRRSIGSMNMRKFTPFLMLDHFNVIPPAGFPDHPHHGQETITYVSEGMVAHEDFTGSRGYLRKGDLQFMTAGKGVCHSEMPIEMENGQPLVGLQLWVDLPTELKSCEPRYRDLKREEIPHAQNGDNMDVEVISGNSYGIDSVKDLSYTPIDFYIFRSKESGIPFKQNFDLNKNVFVYIMKGSIKINDISYSQYSSIFFNTDGDYVEGVVSSPNTEFAIIGGKMLDQETVQYGPFVEETRQKLLKVFADYQNYTNGFERAKGWKSSIADGIKECEIKVKN